MQSNNLPNKLGTCCQILDANGKQYANTVIGTVQQATLDKILASGLFDDHKVVTQNPAVRLDILQNNPVKFKQCHDKVLTKVKQNLAALLEQLKHISRMPEDCKMFRISSNLLPVFDHPEYHLLYDDKLKTLVEYGLKLCKRVIDEHNIVVSCHPDKFSVINSDKESVRLKSFITLEYHRYFMEQLTTYNKSCINVHINGKLDHTPEFDQGLYPELRKWLSCENDDCLSHAGVLETLAYCQEYNIKMVYDVHHDYCENSGTKRHADDDRIMASIINTWQGQTPIFHVSDSRDPSGDTPRRLSPHSDYINCPNVVDRVSELLEFAMVDVESKKKNLSTLGLRNKLLFTK